MTTTGARSNQEEYIIMKVGFGFFYELFCPSILIFILLNIEA